MLWEIFLVGLFRKLIILAFSLAFNYTAVKLNIVINLAIAEYTGLIRGRVISVPLRFSDNSIT